jgi:glutamate-1-semialdehyde 2,1-aminomutase
MKDGRRLRDVEAEREQELCARDAPRDGPAPLRRAPSNPKPSKAGGLEEAELVAAELARLARPRSPEGKRDAESRSGDELASNANASHAVRRPEEDPAHADRGHVRAQEEDGRLVSERDVRADVELRERRQGQATETPAVVAEPHDRDEVLVADARRLEAAGEDARDGLPVGRPACEDEIANVQSKPHRPTLRRVSSGGMDRDRALAHRALAVIPGGVNSPVRALGAVGLDDPIFLRRGSGAHVEDVDGRRYVDWMMSWGPLVFGHADPEIVAAVCAAAADGTTFGAATEREVELAEEICAAFASIEKVRLVSSGTEAAMTAIRLARGVTGRDRVLKFAGCYHGHVDALLASAGSGLATLGIPASPGVPAAAAGDTIVCPYNDVSATAHAVDRIGDDLACVIVEPVAANMGVVPPEPGFLEALRAMCDRCGALLVFDEVITGFRLARGGAQERFGLEADLTILGKIVGGGLPLAAVGGRGGVMDGLAPAGPVYQAGTLAGNPLATAAALVVLRRLRDPAVYEQLERTAQALASGLTEAGEGRGARVQRVGALLTLFFSAGPVRDFADAAASDTEAYGAFFRALLEQGVYLPPSQFEALFVSTAHGAAEVSRTVEAAAGFFARGSAAP